MPQALDIITVKKLKTGEIVEHFVILSVIHSAISCLLGSIDHKDSLSGESILEIPLSSTTTVLTSKPELHHFKIQK